MNNCICLNAQTNLVKHNLKDRGGKGKMCRNGGWKLNLQNVFVHGNVFTI